MSKLTRMKLVFMHCFVIVVVAFTVMLIWHFFVCQWHATLRMRVIEVAPVLRALYPCTLSTPQSRSLSPLSLSLSLCLPVHSVKQIFCTHCEFARWRLKLSRSPQLFSLCHRLIAIHLFRFCCCCSFCYCCNYLSGECFPLYYDYYYFCYSNSSFTCCINAFLGKVIACFVDLWTAQLIEIICCRLATSVVSVLMLRMWQVANCGVWNYEQLRRKMRRNISHSELLRVLIVVCLPQWWDGMGCMWKITKLIICWQSLYGWHFHWQLLINFRVTSSVIRSVLTSQKHKTQAKWTNFLVRLGQKLKIYTIPLYNPNLIS